MQFDNVPKVVKEARWHLLPAGDFLCTYLDSNSPEYARIKNKYTAPVRKLIERELLPPEKDREIMISAFVECCVKNWRHVTVGGKDVEYSQEGMIELLKQSAQTFYDLLDVTRDQANYQATQEQIKN